MSAAALLGAAFAAYDDPYAVGRAIVSRLAGEVADGLIAEWRRIERDELFDGPAEELYRWSEPPTVPPETRDLLALREQGHAAFDAFLTEAMRLEVGEQSYGGALQLVEEALERPHDAGRRAEARLRSIQLAAKLGDEERVREHWNQASIELAGTDARGDTAYLLLCGLAAMPHLDASAREHARSRLGSLWAEERLALPADAGTRAALARELVAAGVDRETLVPAEESRRLRELEALLGELPPPSAGLGVIARGDRLFLHRAAAGGQEGRLVARAALEAELRSAAEEHELLPQGFALDLAGDDVALGEQAREWTPLLGADFGFVLRHEDPDAVAEAESVRIAFLQGGLVLMALLVAAATVFTWRALRRERKLAGLKSSFIANVSHELRTPLSSILLMAENLEEGRVGDEARDRYHRLIRRESQRLRRLVDDVLDFSRLDRGEPAKLRAEDADLAAFARGLEEELRERVEGDGGTLDFRANGVPERMRCDGEALRRAVMNLVDNALKHSGQRDVAVRVDREGEELVIAVRDRGRGVPEARRAEVFEPFARLDGDDAVAGTGLGLAIVLDVARAHGGTARVRAPEEGPGAVFEVRLPLDGEETA